MKQDILDRNDLKLLVDTFYSRVREDEELGPIFNAMIDDWDTHLEKITNFWEQHVFGVHKYFGNPIEAHNRVDAHENNQITPHHFGTWLYHWIRTLDELFVGRNVELLKFKARKMQTVFFLQIVENRNREC